MISPFSYSTTYVLDKSHFSETYDESVSPQDPTKAYVKSLVLALAGLVLLYTTEISGYVCWFLIALGGLEALSVRYQRAWWLTRQMWSRAANNQLTLTIDEQGVNSHSVFVDSKIGWADIRAIEPTRRGWLLHQNAGKTYLSNRCLSDEARAFLTTKASQLG